MKVTNEFLHDLAYELEDRIDGSVTLEYGYSGRGMYGERCVGIVTSASELQLGLALGEIIGEFEREELYLSTPGPGYNGPEFRAALFRSSRDNMGYDTIVYFPNLKATDPNAENEEI